MNKLNDKVIVITGASSGIGRATAILSAKQGAVPVLLARSETALDALAQEIKLDAPNTGFYTVDVTNSKQVSTVIQEIIAYYGKIDVLINNAGYGVFSFFTETPLEEIKGMMEVNYFGLVHCTKAVLPHMLEQRNGHIINVASVAGKLATPKSSGYSASKFAVIGLTQCLRQELKGTGVSVSSISPGPVQTPFFDRADATGRYKRNVESFMIKPELVAKKILGTIHTRSADVTIPTYMHAGVLLYHLFPKFFERFVSPRLNKK
jgi:short-subunit dehydrogenase